MTLAEKNELLLLNLSMDETSGVLVSDSSTNRNDGTMTPGNLPSVTGADGKLGLRFNGTDEYINMVLPPVPEDITALTILVDFKFDGGPGTRRVILETSDNFSLSIEIGTDQDLNGSFRRTGDDCTFNGPVLVQGQRYKVAFVYNGRRIRVYVDGVYVGRSNEGGGDLESMNGLHVGTFRSANNRWFDGVIYEVQIYHSELTDNELAEYSAGSRNATLVDYAIVGAATKTGAVVAAKTKVILPTKLAVYANESLILETAEVTPDANNRVKIPITGLDPNKRYTARIMQGDLIDVHNDVVFRTHPEGNASFTFATSSCASGADFPNTTSTSDHPVFTHIAKADPLFFVHTGDLHYFDIAVNNILLFLAAFDSVMSSRNQRGLFSILSLLYMWSDHDYGPNNSNSSSPSRPAAIQSYRDLVPHLPLPDSEGIYTDQIIGRVHFIYTDERAYRDTSAATILGTVQKQWLKDTMLNSSAELFIVFVGVPWIAPSNFSDTWGGIANAERTELADFFQENGFNGKLLLVHGDDHASAYDDGTNSNYATSPEGKGPAVLLASSLDSAPIIATYSGPYSSGAKTLGPGQYSLVGIRDDGDKITVTCTGVKFDGVTESQTFQHSFSVATEADVVSGIVADPNFATLFADSAAAKVIVDDWTQGGRLDLIVDEVLADTAVMPAAVDAAIANRLDGVDLTQVIADAIATDWVAGDASPMAVAAALVANPTFATLVADAAATKVTTDKLDPLIEPGAPAFTAVALEGAPTGGGGSTEGLAEEIVAAIVAGETFIPNNMHVWQLARSTTGVIVRDSFVIKKAPSEKLLCYVDFSALLGKGEEVSEILSLDASGGTVSEVVASRGILGRFVFVELEAGDVGDRAMVDVIVKTTRTQELAATAMALDVV